MSLKKYSHVEMADKSLIELAKLIMSDEREAMNFNDIFTRVANLKGLGEDERRAKIGQFYTDINVDGHFITNGSNVWGLKSWYRMERIREEAATVPKRKSNGKRKRHKPVDEDEANDLDDYVMIDEDIDEMVDVLEDFDEFDDEYDEKEE